METTAAMLKCHSIVSATGVSQGLISKIVKEGHAAEEAGTKIRTPESESDSESECTLAAPFRIKKSQSNRKMLMERNAVSAWKAKYFLEKITKICVCNLWLTQNKIDYGEEFTKPQLLEIIKRNKPVAVFEIEKILEENGHKCLYLPPYHCDLNRIELIWSSMKRRVADVNIDHKNSEIPCLVQEAFESITVREWAQHCNHVRKLQVEYLKHDVYLESDSDNDDMDISGVWPHTQDEVGRASSSKDHNYCKPGF
ncbi:hypothetical protein evm_009999 [Chilo suppressalis]|nr:hypothetical protein evm_009999 [Chilo suppressalis]